MRKELNEEDCKDSLYDVIFPADRVSNVRYVKHFIPKNETDLERRLREERVSLYHFSHHFWFKSNSDYEKNLKNFLSSNNEAPRSIDEFFSVQQKKTLEFHRNYTKYLV
ncbi:Apoptogenic protein 1, mitochondrial [Thelohanellus kitauei]|uniref:Apoptogenic protein 1, mitochondrial n=1 Tax=Thelohanellus kitauei TaxID=669202 RepID=A0A0C2ICN8_THEKT|nr:Apoptogenic protein 1, mitochondrial [Thelohanellus kitauei]